MIEVRIPGTVSLDHIAEIPEQIAQGLSPRIESREEGDPPTKYRVWLWDDSVAPVPTEQDIQDAQNAAQKASLIAYTRTVARSKRLAALGVTSAEDETTLLADMFADHAVVTFELDNNRRGNPVDTEPIDSVRALAQAMKPIQKAKRDIITKLKAQDFSNPQSGDYLTHKDIDTASEWP